MHLIIYKFAILTKNIGEYCPIYVNMSIRITKN